jgi:subtilisin family serine protease
MAFTLLPALSAYPGGVARVYMIELETPPAATLVEGDARAKSAAGVTRARVQAIAAEQAPVLRALQAKDAGGAEVLFTAQRVYNGIAVRITGDSADSIRALPGVKAVHRMRPITVNTETSVPFLGVPVIWQGLGFPLTGAGISIGIIDTGIDYFHPVFGGDPALKAGNDPRAIEGPGFPSAKIVGGYDFVGDDYDPDDPLRAIPVPDPDPMDQNSHGTHVAGIAAGYGMDFDGKTYTGPYTEMTDVGALRIGPGVAPEADLYALKVFGASGTSFHVLPAIEWAVDPNGDGDFSDRLDVINLSLGDTFGNDLAPEAVAVQNAAAAGVVVVAAAGNQGDIYFVVGNPGVAPAAITVAASEDDDPESPPDFAPDRVAPFTSRGPAIHKGGMIAKPDLTAPGRNIRSATLVNPARLGEVNRLAAVKSGTSMATPHIAGLAALMRQLHPGWAPEAIKAALVNTAPHDLFLRRDEPLPRLAVNRVGSGRADMVRAAANGVIAYDAAYPERTAITFDTRHVTGPVEERKTLRIENRGDTPVTYDLALDVTTNIAGVSRFLEPSRVGPLAPGATAEVIFRIQTDVHRLRHPRDPALRTGVNEFTRHWLSEFSGYISLTPVGGVGTPLRVPFFAAPRPASAISGEAWVDVRTEPARLALGGRGLISGPSFPFDFRALTTPLELLAASPENPALTGYERAGGLRYIGITTNYPHAGTEGEEEEDEEAAFVWFGVATWAPWHSLNSIRFAVDIDTDRDGEFDYLLYVTSAVSDDNADSTFISDVFVTRLSDLKGNVPIQGFVNHFPANAYDTGVFDTNVAVLPVKVEDLGLPAANPAFDFRVRTTYAGALPGEGPIEESEIFTYDPSRPALDFCGGENRFPGVFTDETRAIPVAYDARAFIGKRLGVLLLHHHNAPGERAQWVRVMNAGPIYGDDPDGPPAPDPVVEEAPAPPEGVTASQGEFAGWVRVTWRAAARAREYRILRAPSAAPDAVEPVSDWISAGDLDALRFDDATAAPPQAGAAAGCEAPAPVYARYVYQVEARNTGGVSAPSTASAGYRGLELAFPPPAPETPAQVRATGGTETEFVRVTWARAACTTAYRVFRSDGGEFVPVSGWLDANTFDFEDTSAEPARLGEALDCEAPEPLFTEYRYTVRARNAEVEGVDSAVVTGYRGIAEVHQPEAPAAPTGVTASDGASADFVRVTWEAVPCATAYRVYRAPGDDPAHAEPVSDWLRDGSLRFDDFTAAPVTQSTPGGCAQPVPVITEHTYWVGARNDGGQSTLSLPDRGHRGAGTAAAASALLAVALALACLGRRRPS